MKKIVISLIFILAFHSIQAFTITDGYTDKQSYRAGETVTFYLTNLN